MDNQNSLGALKWDSLIIFKIATHIEPYTLHISGFHQKHRVYKSKTYTGFQIQNTICTVMPLKTQINSNKSITFFFIFLWEKGGGCGRSRITIERGPLESRGLKERVHSV